MDKKKLNQTNAVWHRFATIGRGFLHMIKEWPLLAFLGWAIAFCLYLFHDADTIKNWLDLRFPAWMLQFWVVMALILFIPIYLYALGRPKGASRVENNLKRIGFLNAAGECPHLIANTIKKDMCVMEFETYGIPLQHWLDKRGELQSALNLHISEIYQGKTMRRIIMETTNRELKDFYKWKDSYLNPNDFILSVGMKSNGIERIDFNVIPHILCAGATGSGKSQMAKSLLKQCVLKNADVYIVDYKGGIDYPNCLKENTTFVTEDGDLIDVLEYLVTIIESRKELFRVHGTANLKEYNEMVRETDPDQVPNGKRLPRIVLAIDELAECTDTTGASPERKKVVNEIIHKLSVIARLGRAFGVHLIVSTQRPDANILPGQIKNNMDYRICGRADDVLSKIILDNTKASEIPKHLQGRFILHDGTEIQGFYSDKEK